MNQLKHDVRCTLDGPLERFGLELTYELYFTGFVRMVHVVVELEVEWRGLPYYAKNIRLHRTFPAQIA